MRPALMPEHLDFVQKITAGAFHVILQLVQVTNETVFTHYPPP